MVCTAHLVNVLVDLVGLAIAFKAFVDVAVELESWIQELELFLRFVLALSLLIGGSLHLLEPL